MRRWLQGKPLAEYIFRIWIIGLIVAFVLSLWSLETKAILLKPLSEATIGDLFMVAILIVIFQRMIARGTQ